jgi:predicted transposase YdaD
MRQVVVYLQPTGSNLIQQNSFTLERTHHEFDVICLWQQPAEVFLQHPGLLPFAALSQSDDVEATLRQVARIVDQISDPTMQANLTAASAILAGIRLEEEVIYQLLRKDIMQESVIYRSIQEEAQNQEKRSIALNFLRDGLSVEAVAHGTGLSVEEVQQLQQQIDTSLQN